jgi:Ca-activated chloride channel homolog
MPKITVNVNRSHVELGHDEQGRMNEIIMRLTLLAPELTQTQRPRMPLNIGLVIDRSGSMSGQKLADAVAACQRIVSRLISEDRCTIVTFDDEVSLLADGNYVTPAQRTLISTALGVVRSGGSTNLSGGWQLAADTLLTHHARNGYVSRAVLLTDGQANAGITSEAELGALASNYHSRGISTSTYGLGGGYNEDLLTSIAAQGRGNHQFIEQSVDIDRYFSDELQELFAVSMRNVTLTIPITAGFTVEVVGQLPHRRTDSQLIIEVGAMVVLEQRNIYLRLIPQTDAPLGNRHITATMSGLDSNEQAIATTCDVDIHIAPADVVAKYPVDTELEQEAMLIDLAWVRSEANRLKRERRYDEASTFVRQMRHRSRIYAKFDIYEQLAGEMHHYSSNADFKNSSKRNFMSSRASIKDLPRLRAELAELKQRGESGTDVMQLELTIAYLEEQLRNNGNR